MKLPVVSLAILGGQIALAAGSAGGDWKQSLNNFQSYYTGIDLSSATANHFVPANLVVGYGPWLLKRFIMPIARPGRSLGRYLPVSLS